MEQNTQQQSIRAHNPPMSHTTNKEDDVIDLREYIAVLIDSKKLIGTITVIVLIMALIYCFIATPQYAANALVQVESNQGPGLAALEDVAGMFESESSIETEIELIRSRMVLGKAARQLGLDLQVSPRYFPFIGGLMARQFEQNNDGVATPLFGLSQYAWGGEKLVIDVLELPDILKGKSLLFRVKNDGEYVLEFDGNTLVEGKVGEFIQVELSELPWAEELIKTNGSASKAAINRIIQIHISTLRARPDTEFTLIKRPLHDVSSDIANRLNVSEKGKKSGILSLSFVSDDQSRVADILNEIASVYVDQNLARSSAEAQLSLEFLEEQLPPLKEQLDAAENAYNVFRVQHGSIDLQAETESVLVKLSNVGAAILELEQQRKELRKRFKPAHPTVLALDGKIALLKEEEARLESSSDALPDVQRDILRLAREVEMNTILYSKLLNTSQELKVAKAGTVGNVRIIDDGYRPAEPVKPNKKVVVILGAFVGLFIGIITAFSLRMLRGGIDNPDLIEKSLGIPIYSSVIHSEEQAAVNKVAKKNGSSLGLLMLQHPDSLTAECFRSLRTSLHFSLQNASNNIILIAGSSSLIGKTFTSINLAAVLAEAGKKVLVIDADMRRGTLHKYLGIERDYGLSDIIMNPTQSLTDFVKNSPLEGLDIITSGEFPASPAELLLHEKFKETIKQFSEEYDYVIIDGPPILAVTDSAIIGRHAGTTLMVVKSNYHHMRELEQAQRQFKQAGIEIKGIVFNDVKQTSSTQRYGRYVYRYEYKTE